MRNTGYRFQFKKGCKKVFFYIGNFSTYILPDFLYRKQMSFFSASLTEEEKQKAETRISYYNQMSDSHNVPNASWTKVREFRFPFGQKQKYSTYFFDLYKYIRYFNPNLRFTFKFGDITEVPKQPTIVKSRPVTGDISNAVLLKLNQLRHFVFISDIKAFQEKKNMLVSRNFVRQPHRKRLLEMYYGHPMCNLGQTNNDTNHEHPEWLKEHMTISQQLEYKFICCIEGNDVATNLKWVMSSNSLAVMPRPKYETWFMEGKLIPNYHYVEIKEDYSDLIERLEYYIQHPEEAESIIKHAHEYIIQFKNPKIEKYIALSVIKKYFANTGQK